MACVLITAVTCVGRGATESPSHLIKAFWDLPQAMPHAGLCT